jgi:hypothetical protein
MASSGLERDNSESLARFKDLLEEISAVLEEGSEKEKLPFLALLKESRLWELVDIFYKQQRRKHPRKGCSMEIDCATWRGGFDGVVTDISLGGMFIETDSAVSPQEQITANLYPHGDADPIRITGQVVWTPRRGVGVKFTSSMTKDLKKIIDSL